jgi:D-lactate dehydrogenase (cytochrome)
LPDYVAYARTTDEVAAAVRLCAAHRCPVVAWGAGTSLEGNALAIQGGLCLDLSTMAEILAIHADDFSATVQAGVRRKQLNAALRSGGLFFPVDPGADATLGGMAATRASGTNTVRYGAMRTNVLSCTAVMANGDIVQTARRAPKSAAGYDLTALMVGSEGTLGIITELTLRLYPLPEAISALVCCFESVGAAVQSVIAAKQCALGVARIELLDEPMMVAINRYQKSELLEKPTLFVEFHGSAAGVAEQVAIFEALVGELGGNVQQRADRPEEQSALWEARHNALYATRAMRPNARVLITDVCVPVSRLADCLEATREDLDGSPLSATIAGHVGDGNFHAFILVDPAAAAEIEEAEALHERMALRAIAMDGTCTGEHGVGIGKRRLLAEELRSAIPAMRWLKMAFDPANILNPGKILPG